MKAFNVQQRLEYFRGFLEVTRERNWSRAILEHSPRNGQRTVRGRADSACIVLGTRKLFLLARGPLRITQHARTTLVPFVDVIRQSGEAHELKASPVAQMFSTTHSSRDRRHVACVTPWAPSSWHHSSTKHTASWFNVKPLLLRPFDQPWFSSRFRRFHDRSVFSTPLVHPSSVRPRKKPGNFRERLVSPENHSSRPRTTRLFPLKNATCSKSLVRFFRPSRRYALDRHTAGYGTAQNSLR